MSNLIYKILSWFFGPNHEADARHMAEVIRLQHDPLAQFIKQRAEPFQSNDPFSAPYGTKPIIADDLHEVVSAKWTTSAGLKDYEAFGIPQRDGAFRSVTGLPAKPLPISAPPTSKKQAILNYIKVRSPKGVTAENVGRAFPTWRYSTISARISELYKSGTIVSVGVANTSGGSLASVFAVTE